MTQLLNYFTLLILCLLHHPYQTVSFSIQADGKSTKVTNVKQVAVRFNLGHLVPETSIGTPKLLPVHHMRKRAINPDQGSSWLRLVWRERQFKIPQMFLTNIRNLWAVDPAGGRHLFDADVPYGAVYLVKTLLLDVLFPRIGKNQ